MNGSGVMPRPASTLAMSSFCSSIDSLIHTLHASRPSAMTSSVTFGAPAS